MSKYFADYDQTSVVSSATSVSVSIASFADVIGADVTMTSEIFGFNILSRFVKMFLKQRKRKKKKHGMVILKSNKIQNIIAKPLIDNKTNHKDFTTIMNEG